MVESLLRWLTPAMLCATAWAAAAQTPPASARKADPLDADAVVPAVVYASAFSRDQQTAERTPIPWRQANATVARIGGWRAYAREVRQPGPAAATSEAATPKPDPKAMPVPPGHGGHKMP